MPPLNHSCRLGFHHLALLVCFATVTTTGSVMAQEPETDTAQMRSTYLEAAQQLEIQGGLEATETFELLPRPVLNWTNPQRRTPAGAIFLWTLRGRPQVAMCTYPNSEMQVLRELQSLSSWPLSASIEGQIVWAPREPGIEWRLIEDAPAPGASAAVRRRQMRQLARSFSATLVHPNKNPAPLRMLSTPIYQYPEQPAASEVLDGAMFAFVLGTDPEVLLSIEAIQSNQQEPQWRYGAVRMSMVPTQFRHATKLVWETGWANERPTGPYYTLPVGP